MTLIKPTAIGRPWRLTLTLTAIFALCAVALPSSSASSGWGERTKGWKTFNHGYSVSRDFMSKDLKVCFHVVLSGTLRYQANDYYKGPNYVWDYRNPELVAPRIDVVTKSGCSRTATLRKSKGADLKQAWYDSGCHLHPSITAGVPWTVGVSVSPSCGANKTASRSTSPRNDKGATGYFQANSGVPPVAWRHTDYLVRGICVYASATATVYKANGSDTKVLRDVPVCDFQPTSRP